MARSFMGTIVPGLMEAWSTGFGRARRCNGFK
jgi:hypothetical protein